MPLWFLFRITHCPLNWLLQACVCICVFMFVYLCVLVCSLLLVPCSYGPPHPLSLLTRHTYVVVFRVCALMYLYVCVCLYFPPFHPPTSSVCISYMCLFLYVCVYACMLPPPPPFQDLTVGVLITDMCPTTQVCYNQHEDSNKIIWGLTIPGHMYQSHKTTTHLSSGHMYHHH